ncbi:MAG: GIY-YIG nuclease family protein [Faecalibacterium sp.]|nr:GIY-YIG nuclease family protein [Ruminococcus sp.]MCM1392474.1 GIY-YIG nuclease family protein [Ruminococcus sp.]MCM1486207.1 GIY-YIG nuclease family protein [Faecalibacterium sp.]
MKKLKGWQIVLLVIFWPVGLIYLILDLSRKRSNLNQNNIQIRDLNAQINMLKAQLAEANAKLNNPKYKEYEKSSTLKDKIDKEIQENNEVINRLHEKVHVLTEQLMKLNKQQTTAQNKLNKTAELQRSVEYSIDNFFNSEVPFNYCKLPTTQLDEMAELSPTVTLKLHSMDLKELRKAFKKNDKDIENVLSLYLSRYTTKANRSIYQLTVISLRSELQNILTDLKYEKLDVAIDKVKSMTAKYLAVAGEGNQSIVSTLTKFVGQIEYLFINAVKIEYNYYVKKEQARQEQLAIREQMRIEAQERKALEAEKKKIEKEESKYKDEIEKLKEQRISASDNEIDALNARIAELQAQLSSVVLKKDEIVNLQNGKAGNIYIISNLGSFGENVFKIGMTRRLDPQERINELGSASVPFKFDVHSFIFSEDAVELENRLHTMLNSKRVNKVNLRKEFFNVSLDELEELVTNIDPTAEFNRTMAAEEYRQSLSTDEVYTSSYQSDIDELEE